MSRDAVRLGAIAAVAVAVLGAAAWWYQRSAEPERSEPVDAQARAQLVRRHSPSLGPRDAKVTVVEFLDPECESCRLMHPIVKRLIGQHPADVRLVLRYMPLHGNSVYAAGALEAAGEQGRFWEMLDVMFEKQPQWGSHGNPRPELIPGYARALGLDMQAFEQFMAGGTYRALVAQDKEDGIALGVRGTPTLFVNGRELSQLGYAPLKALIEQELGAAD